MAKVVLKRNFPDIETLQEKFSRVFEAQQTADECALESVLVVILCCAFEFMIAKVNTSKERAAYRKTKGRSFKFHLGRIKLEIEGAEEEVLDQDDENYGNWKIKLESKGKRSPQEFNKLLQSKNKKK